MKNDEEMKENDYGLEIRFEGKNGSQVHNWDPTMSKMQKWSDKNVFEDLKLSKSP
jgi:hypothetical protein